MRFIMSPFSGFVVGSSRFIFQYRGNEAKELFTHDAVLLAYLGGADKAALEHARHGAGADLEEFPGLFRCINDIFLN